MNKSPLATLRLACLGIAAASFFSLPALGQGQYANHQRHVDDANIHLWWDTSTVSQFGNGGLASIQDLNGDGHRELLIGMPGLSSTVAGKVLILSGREGSGLLATLTEPKAGGALGYAIAVIGDVDGDKIDDFVVSSPNATVGTTAEAGMVQLYSGKIVANKLTLLHTFNGTQAKGQFGYSVAAPGDMDGDGFADIAIGEPGDIPKVAGAVSVYSGNPKHAKGAYALIFRQTGLQVGERYGAALAAAGDVNADKRPDLIVGAAFWDGPGGKDHGRAEALSWTGTTSPRVFQLAAGNGAKAEDRYGHSVAGVGMLSGSAMVIVGAPYDDTKATNAGMAKVLSPGQPWIPALTLYGDTAEDLFGYCVAGCRDLDFDGNPEFAVSAPLDEPVKGVRDGGSVFVYSYSTTTKAVTVFAHQFHAAAGVCSGASYGTRYGITLASVGDVDQDDFGDLLVGCDWWYYCGGWKRLQRRVYLDSPVAQSLYADRGHAVVSKGQVQVSYSVQAGKAFAGQLLVFLGSGPHNTARPAACMTKIGKLCLPVQWGSPWFSFSLSNALNPVVLLLDANGNGSLTMSLPSYTGTALPLKVYSTGLMLKLGGAAAFTGVTNTTPLSIR